MKGYYNKPEETQKVLRKTDGLKPVMQEKLMIKEILRLQTD
jgi:hypothetical protein